MVGTRDSHPNAEPGPDAPDTKTKPAIVGIGASAGGIQALQAFFDALPDGLGAAFVVVVHLDPESQSDLAGILGTRTRMTVTQVEATADLEADHVYVIPPNRRLHITDHEISAIEFDEPRGRRVSIDFFFRSLAERHGDGFAVILSGAGSDGTIGVKAVKEAGGIILVQDPDEAEYGSMPRSAIATGLADFVLPVRDIAGRLVELVQNKENARAERLQDFDEDLLRRIISHVRVRTGQDFSQYKRTTVLRRIARRMQVTRSDDMAAYYDYLRDTVEESQALLGDLLISVTTFFRDSEAFEVLAAQVVPRLFDGKEARDSVRVWVPGCATGEEAYTLAMLLLEEVSRHEIRPTIQVFGSDLDATAITTAREGRYPAAIEADVTEDRLRRYFTREGELYCVKRELRDVVLFASHSLLKDPPFSRLDLISCRNLLIYLDRELQQQVCGTFHYALNPGGFLLLGSSETAESTPGLFQVVDRKARIYQSLAQAGDKPRLIPRLLGSLRTHGELAPLPERYFAPVKAGAEAALHRQALEKVAPPNILVDSQYRVVHLSENAGRYLQPSGGPLTSDATELVRPELRFVLRTALRRAFEQGELTLTMPILVSFNGAPHRIYIQARPVPHDGDASSRMAVVLFIEGEPVEETLQEGVHTTERLDDEAVRQLTQELLATQTRLRTMREESEAANEELRAANEELQSINEEYRSTSEELETSREELQSINEELQTVNNELKLKLDAVSRAHSDLQNLVAATDFGTLFLDPGLRIKRFTQRVTDLFSITPSDEGRPITDFTHKLDYDGLIADARAVIEQLAPIEREIRTRDERWYQMRIRPYRTVDDKIDGVVISFVETTERRMIEDALRQTEARLRQEKRLVDLSHEPVFVWDFDGGIVEWNRGSEELYGFSSAEALGKAPQQLLSTWVPGSSFGRVKEELLANGSWSGLVEHRTKDGRQLVVDCRIELEHIDGRRLVLEGTRDVTDRRAWEARQQLLLAELTHRVKNTITVIQSIAHQTLRSSRSNEEFVERFDGRLVALSRAHGLLVESRWKGAELGALARGQVEPHTAGKPARLRLAGEPILLPVDIATSFAMVLHELATNAARHGSLSGSKGSVSLSWKLLRSGDGPPLLTVVWEERDGPPVKKPKSSGIGSTLIKGAIPKADVSYEFRPNGAVCTIKLTLPEGAEVGTASRG